MVRIDTAAVHARTGSEGSSLRGPHGSGPEFPEGFLWGATTSAYQVEGNNRRSDWWAWEHQPHRIHDGSTSDPGPGWWREGVAEADLERAAAFGHNAHRLSLEWGRLEPEVGAFDDDAFDRYRRLLAHAHAHGLRTCVTLNHFTLPLWACRRGGWTSRTLVACFESFARRCAERLGDRVDLWCTLNEPGVLAQHAYLGKRWPPGDGRLASFRKAMHNMLRAHAAAYHMIKAVRPTAEVGLVLAMPVYAPDREHPLDRAAAQAHDWIVNGSSLFALERGQLLPPLAMVRRPLAIAGTFDWLGLNYYGRYRVRFDPRAVGGAFGRHVQKDGMKTATSDWGEPYARGLTEQLLRLRRFGVPIYVTENGAFEDVPGRQEQYLVDHVRAVREAIARGVDVRGYFWWTLVDNFEWAEGWSTPFGMFALDRNTQVRTPRPIARVFEEICRRRTTVHETRAEAS